jgi:hypothetical protein
MNCFDCSRDGRQVPAVAICVRCGAGICADCARLESRRLDQHATLGRPIEGVTRALTCVSCDEVLAKHADVRPIASSA